MKHVLPLVAACLSALAGCATNPDGAPGRDRSTRADDGVEIVYDLVGQGDTALVFIHCWAGDRSFWHREVERFASRYRVLAMDLPGHGQSGDERESWTIRGLGADVERLVREQSLARVILVGHSMGGPIALEAAGRLPGRALGVIGIDTLHDAELVFPKDAAEEIAKHFEQDFDGAMAYGIRAMLPADAKPDVVDWILAKAKSAHRGPVIALFRDFANVDLPALMRAAGVPVRCINKAPFSEQDVATAVETNRRYCDFDAVILSGVGHYPMIEAPEQFGERLEAVVSELVRR